MNLLRENITRRPGKHAHTVKPKIYRKQLENCIEFTADSRMPSKRECAVRHLGPTALSPRSHKIFMTPEYL